MAIERAQMSGRSEREVEEGLETSYGSGGVKSSREKKCRIDYYPQLWRTPLRRVMLHLQRWRLQMPQTKEQRSTIRPAPPRPLRLEELPWMID